MAIFYHERSAFCTSSVLLWFIIGTLTRASSKGSSTKASLPLLPVTCISPLHWMAKNEFFGQGKDADGVKRGCFARRSYTAKGHSVTGKVYRGFVWFVADKQESTLELIIPTPIKARDSFFVNKKEDKPYIEP